VILVSTKADLIKNAQNKADKIHEILSKRFRLRKEEINRKIKNIDKEIRKLNQENVDSEILSKKVKNKILEKKEELRRLQQQLQCSIAMPGNILAVSSKMFHNIHALKSKNL